MQEILDRYSKCPDGAQTGTSNNNSSDLMGHEVLKLRQQLERLQTTQRHMLGEDLSQLTVPDLLQLEQQLDMGSSRVQARKNQLLLKEIEDLRRKEHDLQQENAELLHKLADAKGIAEAVVRGGAAAAGPSSSVTGQPNIPARDPPPGGGSSQTAPPPPPTVYPSHPNLRDPQTSQTSLHLGLFSESFPPSASRRPSQQNPTDPEGETSLRWDHPQFRSQK